MPPQGACTRDHKEALRCNGVQFAKNRACKGPKGCFVEDHLLHCDDTLGDVGDPCMQGAACSADHHALLQCSGGALAATRSCHGPKGCVIDDRGILCDTSIGAAGDVCESGIACAADNRTLLKCQDKKLVEAYLCRGPKGCGVADGELKCDRTAAEAGDGCEQGATCSVDKSKLLECRSGKMVAARECKHDPCKTDEKAGTVSCH